MPRLTRKKEEERTKYETIITLNTQVYFNEAAPETRKKALHEIAMALKAIQENRLYRGRSFKKYCKDYWRIKPDSFIQHEEI